ncbi:hypothetical protein [Variovorax paradoxus]|uniref:hypothetical protein n=1 Tax=Variovorax paradoxus TaxID=34073 RepID=UPI001ABBF196
MNIRFAKAPLLSICLNSAKKAMINRAARTRLNSRIQQLTLNPPSSWSTVGAEARPSLHGLLRYPAMMVPKMQGDIIDAVLDSTGASCRVLDPFVGSGTTMTEAAIRGLDFTGIDINPLAALVCEAKAAVDAGADVQVAAEIVIRYLRTDIRETIDVEFDNRLKWFSDEAAIYLSRLRRAIELVPDQPSRKVLWTAFSETVRKSSNSRTSTYKLHIREESDFIKADRVLPIFEDVLRETLRRVERYRREHVSTRSRRPKVEIICCDVRRASIASDLRTHEILVTSPPYGDNQTTIPYGQFSYLALQWIPNRDLPVGATPEHLANTHALDSASLGGSKLDALEKHSVMAMVSPSFLTFSEAAIKARKEDALRKVATFSYDFFEALSHVRSQSRGSAHWAITTGNRTSGGIKVPLDAISRDIVEFLGGTPIGSLQRRLPSKRMPSRNSMGEMITAETTLVAEFGQ